MPQSSPPTRHIPFNKPSGRTPLGSLPSARLPLRSKLPARTGWAVGVLCGVLVGLWYFPRVRYTLGAQLQFAFKDSIPWAGAFESNRSAQDVSRLDAASSANPDDYLLQVGRATALVQTAAPRRAALAPGDDDRTLLRLGMVAQTFNAPGAYAHLARYMMLDRIRVQRTELADAPPADPRFVTASLTPFIPHLTNPLRILPPTRPAPPRRSDYRLIVWALQNGEAQDKDNAFWPAMLATAHFSAHHDTLALAALARAARKPVWDAYIYEEVLGQWRLYSEAFGDNGATQKVGPLSMLAFPHLRELRNMAALARARADRLARAGHARDAIRVRMQLAQVGHVLREEAQWSLEALCGTDITFIAFTDGGGRLPAISGIRSPAQWARQAKTTLALFQHDRRNGNLAWLNDEIQASCDVRGQVDEARSETAFPGIPPGIPLEGLFGDWMAGVCLLQQAIGVSVAGLLAALFGPTLLRVLQERRGRGGAFAALLLALGLSGFLLANAPPSPRLAALVMLCLTGLFLLLLEGLPTPRREHAATGETRLWTKATTARILLLLLLPGLLALNSLRPFLSGQHPVAVLLTGMVGGARPPSLADAVRLALLAGALPIALVVAAGLWGAYRRVGPMAGVVTALRRAALPAAVCLLVAYLGLLNHTLRLDAEASRAINDATQNDRLWVLTHGESE